MNKVECMCVCVYRKSQHVCSWTRSFEYCILVPVVIGLPSHGGLTSQYISYIQKKKKTYIHTKEKQRNYIHYKHACWYNGAVLDIRLKPLFNGRIIIDISLLELKVCVRISNV